MDPIVIAGIMELAKLSVQCYLSYMKQAGLTEAQIQEVFQKSLDGMLSRDPSKIPD